MKGKRIKTTYLRVDAVRRALMLSSSKRGLSHRAAKKAALYGLNLLHNGASAARAISDGIQYINWIKSLTPDPWETI